MFNLRIVATQNCNNPSFVKNFVFTYLELLNIHKFHPKGPFPIKRPRYYKTIHQVSLSSSLHFKTIHQVSLSSSLQYTQELMSAAKQCCGVSNEHTCPSAPTWVVASKDYPDSALFEWHSCY